MGTKQGKARLFVENILIYGLGGVFSSLVPLLMLPLITRLMPNTADYGLSDLTTTLVQFGCAFAVCGMYDAMYRMFFEWDDLHSKKVVCSTTGVFTACMAFLTSVLVILFREPIAKLFFGGSNYVYLVWIASLTILVSATNQIVSAPTRMENNRKAYLTANIVSPILSYAVSIPLILTGHYIVALPVGALISGLTIEMIFWFLNRKWFRWKLFDKKVLKQLLMIGLPLLPNFLIYWIFNSSDKLMITNLIGAHATGIYSVGAKIGQAGQLIYMAFAGGWQYFAFSTMKEKNQVETNSRIYEYLGLISFVCSILMFTVSPFFFQLLFDGDYLKGYIAAPFLFMAPLLQMLYQVAANQFIIVKKTAPNMIILLIGAVFNVLLNFILIPALGIEGASISTLIGYTVSNIICLIILAKKGLMSVHGRFFAASLGMLVFILLWVQSKGLNYSLILPAAVLIILFICFLYRGDLKEIVQRLKAALQTKRQA